jgi:hypothetical protein
LFFITSFYEYFFDRKSKQNNIPKIFYKFISILYIVALFIILIIVLFPEFYIPYIYALIIAVCFILFPIIILQKYTKCFRAIAWTTIYFTFMSLLYEHVASLQHQWDFPGNHFVGYVQYGGINIPLEEFAWLFLAVPALLSYYEFFADDRR